MGVLEASQFREGEALGQPSTSLLTLFRAKWPTWHGPSTGHSFGADPTIMADPLRRPWNSPS